ncbi:hypothetical protein IM40_05815 [Candidatus Paracaedimonas acanthamoebae]|nr:hypothetical protein IM40_05815 [Candidatus Paracaedimonas acanthamoebae]
MGKIAQLFKVSTVAVLKWIKAVALSANQPNPVASSDSVMIDEMWYFVNEKNKIWLWRAIDGVSRKSLG